MSEQRAALVDDGGTVTNVIIVDTEAAYTPGPGLRIAVLPAGSSVSAGWTQATDGTFVAPPFKSLAADRTTIPGNGTTAAVVTYIDTYTPRPTTVTFTVNGATQTVTLTPAGVAALDVVSSTPGDIITVTVGALPGAVVTITVEA